MTRHFKPVSLLFAMLLVASQAAQAHSKTAFQDAMRPLWEDHVAYTRLYIVSATAGLPDTQVTADRLLKNQQEIGDAVADFYGRPAADQLTALLRDHIVIATELAGAAKAKDQAKTEDAKKRWYANANDIAAFLNKDYDMAMAHIRKMADALSAGIIAQFPAKFDQA